MQDNPLNSDTQAALDVAVQSTVQMILDNAPPGTTPQDLAAQMERALQLAEHMLSSVPMNTAICRSCADVENECDYRNFFWQNILGHEGGYVNDPVDRGGETNFGITIGTWRNYSRLLFGVEPTSETLRNITRGQAFEIFRVGYWLPSGADRIVDCELAFQIADISYNSGSGNSTKILQRAINDLGGNVVVDGAIGRNTINAANALPAADIYRQLRARRWSFYETIMRNDPSQERFRNGWRNRTFSFDSY